MYFWWTCKHACACVCVSGPCFRKFALFIPCLVQMIGFEEAAATKTRYSDNNSNTPLQSPWRSSHVRACDTSKEHGQNLIMYVYGLKSTPVGQGLVDDINTKHAYGPSSAPIAQGLVNDINVPHALGLRESKRTYGSVSTPTAQGLVEIINAEDTPINTKHTYGPSSAPIAQGLVYDINVLMSLG